MRQATAQELRNTLLENCESLVKHKICCATGEQSPLNIALVDEKAVDDIWKAIVPIIQSTSDVFIYDAKSTNDIIMLLGRGKISINDAIKLMSLLQAKQDIEELPKLVEALQTIESK